MNKDILSYHPTTNTGQVELIDPNVLEKTAGVAEDILSFLRELIQKKDKTYALVNALSAGEHYSSNLNGDWFEEKELINYHKTFEALGHIYELHQNKDPKKSLGKVIYSYYNPKMHRVEIVVEFDNNRAGKVLKRIRSGESIATSMGTRVSYEKCSICGNISKVLPQRCDHLKREMHKIYPDGRKVFAYNYAPKFFDISIVRIPADRTSRLLRVVTVKEGDGGKMIIFNKKLASNENFDYTKLASFESIAEIKKEIPAKLELLDESNTREEASKLVRNSLDKDVLYKLSEYSLKDTMATMLALGIVPTPEDFQKIALYSLDEKDLADELEQEGTVFDLTPPEKVMVMEDLNVDNAVQKIAEILEPEIPENSNLELWNLSRALEKVARFFPDGTWYEDQPTEAQRSSVSKVLTTQLDKPAISPVKNPVVPLGILGYLYYGYTQVFKSTSPSKFKDLLAKNTWLLPLVVGGTAYAATQYQRETFKKEASLAGGGMAMRTLKSGLIAYPSAYYLSGKAEVEARQGKQITGLQDFVRKHPALIGTLFTLMGNKAQKEFYDITHSGAKASRLYKTAGFLTKMESSTIKNIQKDLLEV